MQPAVPAGVGVRLVAGVDDRPVQRGLQAHLGLEEVRPLADLEAGLLAGLADADAPRAGDHLAGDQVRGELGDDPVEGRAALQQVVLVGAVGGALAVGVVLVEPDRAPQRPGGSLRGDGPHRVAGLVVAHRV